MLKHFTRLVTAIVLLLALVTGVCASASASPPAQTPYLPPYYQAVQSYGIYMATPPTLTDGAIMPPRLDNAGALVIDCILGCSGGAGGGTGTLQSYYYSSTPPDCTNGTTCASEVDVKGNLKVVVQNTSLPVTESGTWNVNSTTDGTKATAATMPTGGSGTIGWLSGIYNALISTLQVNVTNATLAATQSGTWLFNQTLGTAGFAKITDGTNTASVSAAGAVKVDNSAVTQPVSGTVTTGSSSVVNQTIGAAGFNKLTDGTNTAAIAAPASTAGAVGVNGVATMSQVHCQYNTAAITATGGNFYPCQVDGSGNIEMACMKGCGVGINDAGTGQLVPLCNKSIPINVTTANNSRVQILAAPVTTGQSIVVCGWDVMSNGTQTVELDYGTGTNCATSPTALTGAYPMVANNGLSRGGGQGAILYVPANKALCINLSGNAIAAEGSMTYAAY